MSLTALCDVHFEHASKCVPIELVGTPAAGPRWSPPHSVNALSLWHFVGRGCDCRFNCEGGLSGFLRLHAVTGHVCG